MITLHTLHILISFIVYAVAAITTLKGIHIVCMSRDKAHTRKGSMMYVGGLALILAVNFSIPIIRGLYA